MDDAALAGVIVGYSVIFIRDGFARAVGRRRNRRFAFASADNFDTAMIDCDRLLLSAVLLFLFFFHNSTIIYQ